MNSQILQCKKKRAGGQPVPDLSLGNIELSANRQAFFERSSLTGEERLLRPNRSSNTIAGECLGFVSTQQAKETSIRKLLSPKRSKDCSTEAGFASHKQQSVLKKTANMSGVFVSGSRINSPSEASNRFRPSLVPSLVAGKLRNAPASQYLDSPHFPRVSASRTAMKNSSAFIPASVARNSSQTGYLQPAKPDPRIDR